MSILKYILRSFSFYKKQNLALLAGTILSTAVLTGALIVGDSVNYSLGQIVNKRLGKVDHACVTGERFISDDLSLKMNNVSSLNIAGVLRLKGTVKNPETNVRLNQVDVYGVDSAFWYFSELSGIDLNEDGIMVSENVANRLKLDLGITVLLRMEKLDAIPVNTPFSRGDQNSVSLRLKVVKILSDEEFARFSLETNQKAPYNLFLSKSLLQSKLDLANKSNLILSGGGSSKTQNDLPDSLMQAQWSYRDASLQVKELQGNEILEITSDRIFLDDIICEKIASSYPGQRILSYLVNGIQFNNKSIPYSFVSGLESGMIDLDLADDEIILNDWAAADLAISVGDSVRLEYFTIGAYKELITESKMMKLVGIELNQGHLFKQDLMPDFPGLSDAKSCGEWDTGIPIDLDLIRDKDELYWNEFRGTPKAIVSYASANRMWANAFGSATALRIKIQGTDLGDRTAKLNQLLAPSDIGIGFKDVRSAADRGVANSVDFGELFLSLSFFVIAAAVLLLVLLFALNILSRRKEIKVLRALGIADRKIFQMLMGESLVSILFGGVLGTVLGVYYNKAILYGLNSVWQDAVRTHDLSIHISFGSLLVGLFSGILIAVMAVFFLIRKEIRSKNIQTDHPGQISGKAKLIQGVIAICLLILSIGPVILAVKNGSYDNSALFMASGAFMILFMILFVRLFILKNRNENSMGVRSIPGIWQLAFRNISRKSKRSLVAISMLALGTFSVCITGANRQTYFNDESNRSSGTGGFLYWLESSIAFQTDPNTKEGQASLNISEESILDSIHFVPLLTLQGDDASCLNLNQVTNPQILGVDPTYFDSIKAFSFAGLTGEIDKKAPWLELEHQYDEHTIPAYIDQTVITWGLMKKLGDTLIYLDESGSELNLIIAGGLNNSIFQGNVLIDENKLRKYFPSTRGAKVLLIEGKEDNRTGIENLIDYYFQDFGVEFQRTSVRMMAFNSVSNTYLNVFMLLGALGLLIGTLGFGIILLRNKAERKSELALMQAIGIPEKSIYFMEVMENVILLGIGLGIGLAGTIIGLLPSLISKSASAPIGYMILIILAIFINGLFWILVLGRNSKQKQLPAILRAE